MPALYSYERFTHMRNGSFALEVLVNGVALREVIHQGKTYAVVPDHFLQQEREFVLRVTTPYGGRVEGVISVDGLDIRTGELASADARGYVFNGGSTDLDGWRRNQNQVAAFKLVPKGKSYGGLTGRGQNAGVIGVAFYREYVYQPQRRRGGFQSYGGGDDLGLETMRGGGETMRGGATAKGLGHDAGTGYGRVKDSHVTSTEFTRDGEVSRFFFEYASETSLRQAGILQDDPLGNVNPFPADNRVTGCQPPPGWQG